MEAAEVALGALWVTDMLWTRTMGMLGSACTPSPWNEMSSPVEVVKVFVAHTVDGAERKSRGLTVAEMYKSCHN